MNLLIAPNFALFWLSSLIAALALLIALWRAPWRQLLVSGERQHAFYACALALGLFWLMQVEVRSTLGFHPMLMAVTTMVFGWSLAQVVGALALLCFAVYRLAIDSATQGAGPALSGLELASMPVDYVLSVLVPASWTWLVLWLLERWRNRAMRNPFTYFLGAGFFGAMLSCLCLGAAAYALFSITGSDALLATVKEHVLLFVLMMFPEGFCNGAIATVLTILWPGIVKTYRDEWYLGG